MSVILSVVALSLIGVLLVAGAAIVIRETNAYREYVWQIIRREGAAGACEYYADTNDLMTRAQKAIFRECIEDHKRGRV